MLRARRCFPTPTKPFQVPVLPCSSPEASRACWICSTVGRAGEEGYVPPTHSSCDRATQAFMTTFPNLALVDLAHNKLVQPLAGCHWSGLMPPEHRREVSIWKDTVSSRGGKIPYNLVIEWELDSRIAPQDQEGLLQTGKGQGWRTTSVQGRDRQVWGHTTWFHCSAPSTAEMAKIHLLRSKLHP